MSNLDDKVLPCLQDADALPFLFVGSGFTKRYLGLPTWMPLIEYVASLTYPNEFGFASAINAVNKSYDIDLNYNDYMTHLTDHISNDLDKIWYTDERFEDSRNEFSDLALNKHVSPFKIEVAKYIRSFGTDHILSPMNSEIDELRKIANRSVAGVITTNYDNLVESIFDYETYASQEELLFHTKYDLGEVYKIHGSVSNPESILINTQDYKNIEVKHKYISAKLLTIFVEHPIFFIGYSLGDQDIRNILFDIQMGLSKDQLSQIEKRLFFVTYDENCLEPEVTTFTIDFEKGNSLTIGRITLKNYADLYKTIGQSSTKYPVKLLRYAKRDLYQFTLTTKPTNKVVLSVPEENMNPETLKDVEFIYGFGIIERAEKGYASVDAKEIYRDVLFDDQHFATELLVREALPIALRQSSGFIPLRKYTKEVNFSDLPSIVQNNLDRFNEISKFRSFAMNKSLPQSEVQPADAIKNPGADYYRLALVNWTEGNIELLGNFLRSKISSDPASFKTTIGSRRMIRIYDFVKYSEKNRP